MAIKGYWRLNGNSNDASGNGNNGTDTNITYSQANGVLNGGAGFASDFNSRISFPSYNPSYITIACLFKSVISNSNYKMIFQKDGVGGSG